MFPKNVRIKQELKNELLLYLNSIKFQKNLIRFIFIHSKDLKINDVKRSLKLLDKYAEKIFYHFDSVLANLKLACDMEFADKFYIPRKKFDYIDETNYNLFLNEAKGISLSAVKEFLINEKVFNEEELDNVLKDFIVIPNIVDGKTTLININKLVYKSLLMHKDFISDDIVYGEEIPKFYESLYQKNNVFINEEISIEDSQYLDSLIYFYNYEPMSEQIKKLSKYKEY